VQQLSLDELRVNGRGRYLPHRAGLTHVIEEGQDDQPAMLLVHGATVPAWEFDRLIPHLRAAGWRTIRFDLFGHGLSDRPAVRYDFNFFLEQALEVLDGISSHRPLTLLGHSFGAALAAAMASHRPERIERLVMVAPLLDFMANSLWGQVFALPGIGGLMMRHVGLPVLERRRARRYQAIGAEDLTSRFISEARAPGYADALASMFANRTLGPQREHYQRLQASTHEIFVVAGSADRIVPLRDVAEVRSLLPKHAYRQIENAQHNLLLTHPSLVTSVLPPPHPGLRQFESVVRCPTPTDLGSATP
jgi:pimeloyl-ACP methyl ester carboxylesterase